MTKEELIEIYIEVSNKLCNGTEWCWAGVGEPLQLFAKLVAEKAIKEALAQSEQEPMAWMDKDGDVLSASVVSGKGLRNIPLYTASPQRKPLTDEEIAEVAERMEATDAASSFWREFARAIESAHGIEE